MSGLSSSKKFCAMLKSMRLLMSAMVEHIISLENDQHWISKLHWTFSLQRSPFNIATRSLQYRLHRKFMDSKSPIVSHIPSWKSAPWVIYRQVSLLASTTFRYPTCKWSHVQDLNHFRPRSNTRSLSAPRHCRVLCFPGDRGIGMFLGRCVHRWELLGSWIREDGGRFGEDRGEIFEGLTWRFDRCSFLREVLWL